MLVGTNRLCYVTFSSDVKNPRAVMYKKYENGWETVPWLYLPFSSADELWIFHTIEDDSDMDTAFVFIPEISCMIPTKAVEMYMEKAQEQQKTVALKMLWIGEDAKQRQGESRSIWCVCSQ